MERPLDPAAGPVEAFAFELRKLRAEAGNPTYRALAKAAGYSATTLSEAAAGRRRPSLEVTLAYAGACGGDPGEWARRWQELPGPQPEASSGTSGDTSFQTPAGAEPGSEPDAGVPPAVRPAVRRWVFAAAVAVVAAGLLAGTTAALWPAGDGPDEAAATGCPASPDKPAFTGKTYSTGIQLRVGPSRDQRAIRMIPGGCTIGFTGYCVGQLVNDGTAATPDVRWFMTEGGVVSSALIHGNPPDELAPARCPHGRAVPQEISLRLAAGDGGATALTATGPGVDIAGFTAGFPDDPRKPETLRWHQLNLTAGKLTAVLPASQATGQVLLAAVACLGGGGPTNAAAVMSMPAGHPDQAAAVTLEPAQFATARRSACQYPTK